MEIFRSRLLQDLVFGFISFFDQNHSNSDIFGVSYVKTQLQVFVMVGKLTTGDTFPELLLNILGGDSLKLPAELDAPITLALFYRGHW
tara:strand:- start:1316 stop:1579 length:264 start_codon:yes stop_codon:yes gene_type:complete